MQLINIGHKSGLNRPLKFIDKDIIENKEHSFTAIQIKLFD
jgi:hypothetical protein